MNWLQRLRLVYSGGRSSRFARRSASSRDDRLSRKPRPALELLEERILLNGDLAELNAALWRTFAADGAQTTLSDDLTQVRSGTASIKLVTDSGSDVALAYD